MSAPVARAGADLRLLRAAVFAAVCVVLSAAGHVLTSCARVPYWTLGLGFLAVFAVAALPAGRERSLPAISAALAVGQLALHALFWLGQHTAAAFSPERSSESRLTALAEDLVCGDAPGRLSVAEARRIISSSGIAPQALHGTGGTGGHGPGSGALHAAAAAPSPSPAEALFPTLPMLLGHLLAAVVLGLLLRRGEVALFRLVRLSARGVAEGFAEGALVRSLRAALALVHALRSGFPGALTGPPRAPFAHAPGTAGPPSPALQHSVSRRGPPPFALAA
ncbi:hypothetical protein [Streptomyces sp. 8N706]|uniref:hypothetical protein n=1 Tax=Streptomyces sp. 8N706 TaxID=3457416 RepID=UPI003FD49DB9